MITFRMNGLEVQAEEGSTLLETAKFYGLEIPTLCHNDGLTPFGGCRLCVVEIGEGLRTKLVSSCTYPVEEGLVVRTDSARVWKSRRMMIELMLAMAPGSKILQDMASQFGVTQVRFKVRDTECVMCGLCTRICAEQMDAEAIGFRTGATSGRSRRPSTCARTSAGCAGPACISARLPAPLPGSPSGHGPVQRLPDHGAVLPGPLRRSSVWMYDAGRCGTCVQEKKS